MIINGKQSVVTFSWSLLLGITILLSGSSSNNNDVFCHGQVMVDPVPDAAMPDLSAVPLYQDFHNAPEKFRRIHLHVMGLKKDDTKPLTAFWKLERPIGILQVATYGDDTGSPDYFDVGNYTANPVQSTDVPHENNNYLFEFDFKRILLYKPSGTSGLTFTLTEDDTFNDDILLQFNLPVEEFPPVGSGYIEYQRSTQVPSDYEETQNAQLVFRIKIEEMTKKIVEVNDLLAATYNIGSTSKYAGVQYDETVLDLSQTGALEHNYNSGMDKALVQSWRHVDGTQVQGAVLWLIGRNDCFMHTHVTDKLFFGSDSAHKFDVYVLSWRNNGMAAVHRGWLTDAYYWSHNSYGDFDVYHEEVQGALDLMKPHVGETYNKVLGYGHSTGATILLNYVADHGDASFDGFLLNGPFLDYDETLVNEYLAENGLPAAVSLKCE